MSSMESVLALDLDVDHSQPAMMPDVVHSSDVFDLVSDSEVCVIDHSERNTSCEESMRVITGGYEAMQEGTQFMDTFVYSGEEHNAKPCDAPDKESRDASGSGRSPSSRTRITSKRARSLSSEKGSGLGEHGNPGGPGSPGGPGGLSDPGRSDSPGSPGSPGVNIESCAQGAINFIQESHHLCGPMTPAQRDITMLAVLELFAPLVVRILTNEKPIRQLDRLEKFNRLRLYKLAKLSELR